MKRFFTAALILTALLASCTLMASATENDTLRHIYSFWHKAEWLKYRDLNYVSVLSSPSGDTVVQAAVSRVNKDQVDIDTFVIRVRMWETTNGKLVGSTRFVSTQPIGSTKAVLRLFLLNGIPHVAYCPTANTIHIVNVLNENVVLTRSFTETVGSITTSPDGKMCFVTGAYQSYHLFRTISGEALLDGSTRYSPGKSVDQFVSDQPVVVKDEQWSADGTVVLLQHNQVAVSHPDFTSDYYALLYRAYNIEKKAFTSAFFQPPYCGKWDANAKLFIQHNTTRFYLLALDGSIDSTSVTLNFGCRDFYTVKGTDRMVLVGYTDTISVRDKVTSQVYGQFVPGPIIGNCSNADGTLVAYLTPDNMITVINTITLKGVFSYTIPFNHDIIPGDESSFGFLRGDRVMYIRDRDMNIRFLDVPARTIIATLKSTDEWFISANGNTFFVLDTVYTKFDCFTGAKVGRFPQGESTTELLSFAISPSADQVLSVDSTTVRLWDLKTQTVLASAPYAVMQQCHWSTDGKTIVLGHTDTSGVYTSYTVIDATTLAPRLLLDSASQRQYLGYSPDASHIYFSHADTLVRYDVKSNTLDKSWIIPGQASALCFQKNNDTILVGTVGGSVYKMLVGSQTPIEWIKGWSPIVRVRVNDAHTYMCLSSVDSVSMIKLSTLEAVGRLSTRTSDDFFIGSDSLCLNIYPSAIVEFRTGNGKPTKTETETYAVFRPLKDYYATIGVHPTDRLELVNYRQKFEKRAIEATASLHDLRWSANSAAVAALDIYNNIVVWRPAGLKAQDTTGGTGVVEMEIADLNAAPNPTRDGVFIQNLSEDQWLDLDVYDELGVLSMSQRVGVEKRWVDMRSLPNGVYTIVARSTSTLLTSRIVVLH